MAKKKEPKGMQYIQPVYLPGKHKGKISPAAIRAAVKKVVAARRKREAEAARTSATTDVPVK